MENLENGIARIRPDVYKGILAKLVRTYKYFNNNQTPDKLIIPLVTEVDGIPVEMEGQPATTPDGGVMQPVADAEPEVELTPVPHEVMPDANFEVDGTPPEPEAVPEIDVTKAQEVMNDAIGS